MALGGLQRLPVFCHYCGILGHDLWNCPLYFELSKKNSPVEYQYGDWLKAASGRNKSPPRWGSPTWTGESPLGREGNTVVASNGMQAVETVAARVSSISDGHISHYGKDEINGKIPHI